MEQARAVGVFDHPTGKGDAREELLRDFLRERVGTTFGVTKAEVVDSHDASSHEIDAVIYDQSVASCLNVQGQRRVVRVESVAAAIEVRSLLKAADAEKERLRLEGKLADLVRHYHPTPLLQLLPSRKDKEGVAFFNSFIRGIRARDFHRALPRILNVFFAYDGPDVDTASAFARESDADMVCVLGKYVLARPTLGYKPDHDDYIVWGTGDDALGAFLWQLETTLYKFREGAAFIYPGGAYFKVTGTPPSAE